MSEYKYFGELIRSIEVYRDGDDYVAVDSLGQTATAESPSEAVSDLPSIDARD